MTSRINMQKCVFHPPIFVTAAAKVTKSAAKVHFNDLFFPDGILGPRASSFEPEIFALGEIDITGSWPTAEWQEAICFEAMTIIQPDILAPSPPIISQNDSFAVSRTQKCSLVQWKQRSRNIYMNFRNDDQLNFFLEDAQMTWSEEICVTDRAERRLMGGWSWKCVKFKLTPKITWLRQSSH